MIYTHVHTRVKRPDADPAQYDALMRPNLHMRGEALALQVREEGEWKGEGGGRMPCHAVPYQAMQGKAKATAAVPLCAVAQPPLPTTHQHKH